MSGMEVTKELSSAGIAYADLLHLSRSGRATHSAPRHRTRPGPAQGARPQFAGDPAARINATCSPQPTRRRPGGTLLAVIISNAHVAAPSRQLARKPAGLSHAEAAALPLAGLTAWQALVDTAQVAAGQRVLIHGAGVLHPGGLLVTIVGRRDVDLAARTRTAGRRFAGLSVEPDYPALEALADLAESGRLRVHLQATLDLAEAAKAHELLESGSVTGKIALTV